MNFDEMLKSVTAEARALGIPVADTIRPQVQRNTRAKKRFGRCIHTAGTYTVEISAYLENADETFVRTVLAHEVLHTCPGCMNHGAAWKRYAALMRQQYGYAIARTASNTLLPETEPPAARYVLQCTACGAVFPRQKKSRLVQYPNRYRCKCGGKLTRLL